MKENQSAQPVVVVTGGNRGIGLEVVRQMAIMEYQVVLASRDMERGEAARKSLGELSSKVRVLELDVTEPGRISQSMDEVQQQFGRLDALVNNAGVYSSPSSSFSTSPEEVKHVFETNVYGPMRLTQAVVPIMEKAGYGRIVNISSGMGSFNEMGGGYLAYRMSKTALNSMTAVMAQDIRHPNVFINAMCPGWVRTDMGGASAPRTVGEGADTVVYLATLPEGGPSGRFFRDRQEIAW